MRPTALAVAVFAAYVILITRAARRSATTSDGRRTITTWLLYTTLVIFAVATLQIDLWPFSAWPLVAAVAGPRTQLSRMVAVGVSGREYDVDFRVWQPLIIEELLGWGTSRLQALPPEARDDAG